MLRKTFLFLNTSSNSKSTTTQTTTGSLLKSCTSSLLASSKGKNKTPADSTPLASKERKVAPSSTKNNKLVSPGKNDSNSNLKPPSPMATLKISTSSSSSSNNNNNNNNNIHSNSTINSIPHSSSSSVLSMNQHQRKLNQQQQQQQKEKSSNNNKINASWNENEKPPSTYSFQPKTAEDIAALWRTIPGVKKLNIEKKECYHSDEKCMFSIADDCINSLWQLISRNRSPKPRVAASTSLSHILSTATNNYNQQNANNNLSMNHVSNEKLQHQDDGNTHLVDEIENVIDDDENDDIDGGSDEKNKSANNADDTHNNKVGSSHDVNLNQQHLHPSGSTTKSFQRQSSALAQLMTAEHSRRHSSSGHVSGETLFAYEYLLPFSLRLNSPLDHSRLLVASSLALLEAFLFGLRGDDLNKNKNKNKTTDDVAIIDKAISQLQEAIDIGSTLGSPGMTGHWRCLLAVCCVAKGTMPTNETERNNITNNHNNVNYFVQADQILSETTIMMKSQNNGNNSPRMPQQNNNNNNNNNNIITAAAFSEQFGCSGPSAPERTVEVLPALLQNIVKLEWGSFRMNISVPTSPTPQSQMTKLERVIFKQLSSIRTLTQQQSAQNGNNNTNDIIDADIAHNANLLELQLRQSYTVLSCLLLQVFTLVRAYARETIFSSTFAPFLIILKNINVTTSSSSLTSSQQQQHQQQHPTTSGGVWTATSPPVGNPILYKQFLHILDAVEFYTTTTTTTATSGIFLRLPLDGFLVATRHESVKFLLQTTRLDSANESAVKQLKKNTVATVTSLCSYLRSVQEQNNNNKNSKSRNHQVMKRLCSALAPEFVRLILTSAFLTLELESQQQQQAPTTTATSITMKNLGQASPVSSSFALSQYAYAFKIAKKYKIPEAALDRARLEYCQALCRSGRVEVAAQVIAQVTKRSTLMMENNKIRNGDEEDDEEDENEGGRKQIKSDFKMTFFQLCRLGESSLPLRPCELHLACGVFLQSLGNSHTNNAAAELMYRLSVESASMTMVIEAECVLTALMTLSHDKNSNNSNTLISSTTNTDNNRNGSEGSGFAFLMNSLLLKNNNHQRKRFSSSSSSSPSSWINNANTNSFSPSSSFAYFAANSPAQPSPVTTRTFGKACESLGYLLLLQGRPDEAHEYFRKVLRLMLMAPHVFSPNSVVQTRFRYALALESANQPMRARRVYDQLLFASTTLAMSTGEKLAMTLRSALLHHYTLGEYTEAAALYFVSLALDSENPHNMVQLAWCMLQISEQPDIQHIKKYYDAALLVLHCCESVGLKPIEIPQQQQQQQTTKQQTANNEGGNNHNAAARISSAMQCVGPWDKCYVLGECAVFYHDHIGDLETAKHLYQQALAAASPDQTDNYAQVAANFAVLLCYDLKDPVAAEPWFEAAVRHPKPHNEAALVHLFSEFLLQVGKVARAAEELGKVAAKYGLSDSWHRLAKVEERLYRNGSYGYALSCYSRALGASLSISGSNNNNNTTSEEQSSQQQHQQQQQHQLPPPVAPLATPSDEGLAQLFLNNVHDDMTLPIASDLLLLLHHKYGGKKLAVIDTLYKTLCRAFPRDIFLLVNYARFLNDVAFKPKAALKRFRQALLIDRTNVALLDNLAEHLTQAYPDRLDMAERCHLESVRENPLDPQAHFAYACFLSYYYPANELAEQHFHRALELDSSDTVSLCSYAAFLEAMIENNGPAWEARTDATHYAEEMYREAIRLSPHTASHHLQLACFLWRNERLPEAWEAFETCLELDRANVNALRLAGTFLQDWIITHGGGAATTTGNSTSNSNDNGDENNASSQNKKNASSASTASLAPSSAGVKGLSKGDFIRSIGIGNNNNSNRHRGNNFGNNNNNANNNDNNAASNNQNNNNVVGGKSDPIKNPIAEALANLAEGLFKKAFELDPRDISVLKSFASFLEEVRRDSGTSQELMAAAAHLEMEQFLAKQRVIERDELDERRGVAARGIGDDDDESEQQQQQQDQDENNTTNIHGKNSKKLGKNEEEEDDDDDDE